MNNITGEEGPKYHMGLKSSSSVVNLSGSKDVPGP